MNLNLSLSNIDIYSALLAIVVVIALPARSIYRYVVLPVTPNYFVLIVEYICLLLLLTKVLSVHKIDIGSFVAFDKIFSTRTIIATVGAILFIIGIDYWALIAKKSQILLRSESKLIAQQPKRSIENFGIALFCLLSSFWEESVFRGLSRQIAVTMGLPIWSIAVISSLLFAVHHSSGGRNQIVYSFVFGIIFYIIFILSNSLFAVCIVHAVGNAFVYFYVQRKISQAYARTIYF